MTRSAVADRKRKAEARGLPQPGPIERRPFDQEAARTGAADGAYGDGTAGAR